MPLDKLLETSDFITLHTTLTKESRHLIGKQALAKVKRGLRLVNAARGELVDEEALLAALESGRVAGAALDVHAQEPPTDWRLVRHPRVVATPHVGAATAEAQERVGTDIAVQVRDFLKGGLIQHAVNFFSLTGDVYDRVRPAMDLAERLGLFLAQVCDGSMERVEVGLYGDFREIDVKPILSAAVYGVLQPVLAEGVTLVNARGLAAERGIDVLESTSTARVAFSNLLVLRLKTSECDFSVAGTLFGRNHLRLVDVDGVERPPVGGRDPRPPDHVPEAAGEAVAHRRALRAVVIEVVAADIAEVAVAEVVEVHRVVDPLLRDVGLEQPGREHGRGRERSEEARGHQARGEGQRVPDAPVDVLAGPWAGVVR